MTEELLKDEIENINESADSRVTATKEAEMRYEGLKQETIPVVLPLNLMTLISYPGDARYIAIYYAGTCATWDDGRASATFSYYAAFRPLTEHPSIAFYLLDKDLGSDDTFPTHALICDREERTISVGKYKEVIRFVRAQHTGPPTQEEIEKYSVLLEPITTTGEMVARGMHELFFAMREEEERGMAQLIEWLDRYIDEELIAGYMREIEKGNIKALYVLDMLLKRIKANEPGI